ncbi:hypothetical protein [Nocardia wallacei]|uniref:hypothetical protein n=1 Tax=Nocardia wallacei TaxID=480035 RepID=UPI002457BC2C|nr:hypothetical protein [Nocardia wallacei]
MIWLRRTGHGRNHAYAIIDRIAAERARQHIQAEDARTADAGGWPNNNPHAAPSMPLTVPEAHGVMQRHRGCTVDHCPLKFAAYRILVEAGRIKPDSSRVR